MIKREKSWVGIVKCLLILALFVVIQFVGTLVTMCVEIFKQAILFDGDIMFAFSQYEHMLKDEGLMTSMLFFVTLCTTLVAGIWYYLGYARKKDQIQKEKIRETVFDQTNIGLFVIAGIACYGLAIVVSFVTAIIFPEAMDEFAEMMDMSLGGNTVVMLVTTVILAPVGEEALFRGIIYHKLLNSNKYIVALLLQGILFGVYHGNIIQGLYVLPLALVMGYFVYHFQSIIPSMIIHAVNNGISVLLGFMPGDEKVQMILESVIILATIVSWFILIRYFQQQKYSQQ